MTGQRTLIAGIGNVFLGDDGFGVEVVRRLAARDLPECVDVVDYGIRGVHLAYDLLDGRYANLVMVDAVPFGDDPPGSVAVYEIGADATSPADSIDAPAAGRVVDGHAMHPDAVLETLSSLGGSVDRVLVVGCRPATFACGMQLSASVAAAVDDAVAILIDLSNAEAAGHDAIPGAIPGDKAVRAGA